MERDREDDRYRHRDSRQTQRFQPPSERDSLDRQYQRKQRDTSGSPDRDTRTQPNQEPHYSADNNRSDSRHRTHVVAEHRSRSPMRPSSRHRHQQEPAPDNGAGQALSRQPLSRPRDASERTRQDSQHDGRDRRGSVREQDREHDRERHRERHRGRDSNQQRGNNREHSHRRAAAHHRSDDGAVPSNQREWRSSSAERHDIRFHHDHRQRDSRSPPRQRHTEAGERREGARQLRRSSPDRRRARSGGSGPRSRSPERLHRRDADEPASSRRSPHHNQAASMPADARRDRQRGHSPHDTAYSAARGIEASAAEGTRHARQQPPVPGGGGGGSDLPPAQDDPALNFFSPRFDPLKALYTPGLLPPNPRALPLDNVRKCRLILPSSHPASLASLPQPPKDAAGAKRQMGQSRASAAAARTEAAEAKVPALDRLAERIREGPLLLLRRAYAQRLRVRVVTRHAHGVRGWATGVLRAFDKYMNLVLSDVFESYTVLLRVPRVSFHPAPAAAAPGSTEADSAPAAAAPGRADATLMPSATATAQQAVYGASSPNASDEAMPDACLAPNVSAGNEAAGSDGAGQPQHPSAREAARKVMTERVTTEQEAGEELVERVRWCRKQERRQRRLRQVLLRGDSIVLISLCLPDTAD